MKFSFVVSQDAQAREMHTLERLRILSLSVLLNEGAEMAQISEGCARGETR